MSYKILLTGGAGYIGSHVAIALDKKKLVHAYGPKKKVAIMSISQTINLLQSKGLNIISIKRPT